MSEVAAKNTSVDQVLVICDGSSDLVDMLSRLEGEFSTLNAATISEASKILKTQKPVIAIFDMDALPDQGTHDLVQQVNTPLKVFASQDDTLDQRLNAFGMGGDDFVKKPIDYKELNARLSRLLESYSREQTLIKSSEEATKIALSAMTEASMYGDALRFVNDMHQVTDVAGVKDLFFSYMSKLSLTTSIRIRGKKDISFCSCKPECSPIEMEIFDALGEKDRTISLSNRFIVNGKWVSIIVRDMPVNDDLQMGRLRDILATAADGIDAKVLDLQRVDLIKITTVELSEASKRLSSVVVEHRAFVASAMQSIITDINASFHRLDMTEEQEAFFTDLCKRLVSGLIVSTDKISKEQEVLQCLWVSMDNLVKIQLEDGD